MTFEIIKHSLYLGRRMLGRYDQTEQRRFEAFDAEDRPLGVFGSQAEALATIRTALTADQARGRLSDTRQTCRECGDVFDAKRNTRAFCGSACRRTYNNRKATRGAAAYDLLMAWRFDRGGATGAGAQSALCRMVAGFKAEDDNERDGRRSWDDVARVKARNCQLSATVVAVNVAGVRRP